MFEILCSQEGERVPDETGYATLGLIKKVGDKLNIPVYDSKKEEWTPFI